MALRSLQSKVKGSGFFFLFPPPPPWSNIWLSGVFMVLLPPVHLVRSDKGGICGLWFLKVFLRWCLFAVAQRVSFWSVSGPRLCNCFHPSLPCWCHFSACMPLTRPAAPRHLSSCTKCALHIWRVSLGWGAICVLEFINVCLDFFGGGFITLYIATFFLTNVIGSLARRYKQIQKQCNFWQIYLVNNSHFPLSVLCMLHLWL